MALADRRDRLDVALAARAGRHRRRSPARRRTRRRSRARRARSRPRAPRATAWSTCDTRAEQRAVALAHGLHADEARAEAVRAVVGERAADQMDALRLPLRRPVLARELGGAVDRVAAAETQEDARVRHRRQLDEPVDELERGRVRRRRRTCGRPRACAVAARSPRPSPRGRARCGRARGSPCRRGSACRGRPRGRRPRRARSRARAPAPPPCRRTGASTRLPPSTADRARESHGG